MGTKNFKNFIVFCFLLGIFTCASFLIIGIFNMKLAEEHPFLTIFVALLGLTTSILAKNVIDNCRFKKPKRKK